MISSQSVAFLQYLNLILGGSRIFQGVSVCVCVCLCVGGGGGGLVPSGGCRINGTCPEHVAI